MSRDIRLPDGQWWTVRTGIFSWIVGTLAATARDRDLAAHLREVDEEDLPLLDLTALPADQRAELVELVRALPAVARDHLPPTADHEAVGRSLADLVDRLPPAGSARAVRPRGPSPDARSS
ncbi:hypothetical protein [Kineococcus terrestris]|uniref:hypothetical protein n=1 Tax=Kineococcus terrestris TaxID=2044856 RepID=UPI0034DB1157